MGIRSLPIKSVLLIPYLILVVMLPITRGERLQEYHFIQLTEKYHAVPFHDFPVVSNVSHHNHNHLSLFFYPERGNTKISVYSLGVLSNIVPEAGLSLIEPDRHVYMAACSGPSPPLFYSKTVSGLSPPMPSDV